MDDSIRINELVKSFPTLLPDKPEIEEVGLYYLPFSTGFEIECASKYDTIPSDVIDEFRAIPHIMHVDINNDEQRFRIPEGLKGLQCLFEISTLLKKHHELNMGSGIHYHVDCSIIWSALSKDFIEKESFNILKELDTWEYKGTYNSRACVFSETRNWTRFKSYTKTMEFRIGEMTFDYPLLFKRITHANQIVLDLASKLLDFKVYKYDLNNIIKIVNNRIIQID